MKKSLFVLFAFLFIVFSSQSQIRFGIQGGANLSGVTTNDGNIIDKNVTGYRIGPSIEWLVNGGFGIEGAILYSQKGIKFKNGVNITKNKNGYLDIPIHLKCRINASETLKPYLLAGPYISFKISGDDSFNSTIDRIEQEWRSKGFGAGVNFGAGVEVFGFLQVGANYGVGLTDNYKQSDGTYSTKERTWSATATIYF